jgi:hypothetical protein
LFLSAAREWNTAPIRSLRVLAVSGTTSQYGDGNDHQPDAKADHKFKQRQCAETQEINGRPIMTIPRMMVADWIMSSGSSSRRR